MVDSNEGNRDGSSHFSRPRRRFRRFKKKVGAGCGPRCVGRQGTPISYKEVKFLENYITSRGKIMPRRRTISCAKHQRMLARAIKRARYMAFLPFTADHDFTSER